MRGLPPELAKDGVAVMIALPRGVVKKALSSTSNIIAARTVVQGSDTSLVCCMSPPISCPDVFWKYGIKLQGMFCCQECWNPLNVSARKQFWEGAETKFDCLRISSFCAGNVGPDKKWAWERMAPVSISAVDVSFRYGLAGSAWSLVLIVRVREPCFFGSC